MYIVYISYQYSIFRDKKVSSKTKKIYEKVIKYDNNRCEISHFYPDAWVN